jgi:hypothetical protein
MVLAHLLSDNKWILGLNLGFNRIEEKGIDRLLRDILSPDRIECALICLHIRGNPGCDDRILETLSQIATSNLRHPVFSNETHFEILAVISKWLNEQKGQDKPDSTFFSYPASLPCSRDEDASEEDQASQELRVKT